VGAVRLVSRKKAAPRPTLFGCLTAISLAGADVTTARLLADESLARTGSIETTSYSLSLSSPSGTGAAFGEAIACAP